MGVEAERKGMTQNERRTNRQIDGGRLTDRMSRR